LIARRTVVHIYLVYDKSSGRILHSVSKYVLGNPDPVPMTDEEVFRELSDDLRSARIGVVALPRDFDPRDRSKRVVVEPGRGIASLVAAPARKSRTVAARDESKTAVRRRVSKK
jgi:hypothetical protein